jgi:predicted Holliday junction resolvase-like endonuclease
LAQKTVGEVIVTEIEKLTNLREKLVIRRRSLVEGLQRAAPERLTGESILRIQSAIEAVDRAIEDEMSTHDTRRRAVPSREAL